ncbi:hypothetical protein VW29_13645 [Devosia limi DSM 17137]|uniref:Uncharacterized protein n=1 Tax=Devosia limi DSM 17137 TaxID=1121477 RepID=A0A0F5LND3_9HYPH|nr:hypothetical protein VW29_13645 [Devosia limi DSM 17137]
MVRLAVIDGGQGRAGRASDHVRIEDVEAEAQRRLRICRVQEWRAREFITGIAVPADIKHFELQVNFAAQAICCLSPIPADFDDDLYWPTYWGE